MLSDNAAVEVLARPVADYFKQKQVMLASIFSLIDLTLICSAESHVAMWRCALVLVQVVSRKVVRTPRSEEKNELPASIGYLRMHWMH